MRRLVRSEITIHSVNDGKPNFSLTCLECGGCEQEMRGDPGVLAMLYCTACGGWIGRVAAIQARVCMKAKDLGFEVDMTRIVERGRSTAEANRKRREERGDG